MATSSAADIDMLKKKMQAMEEELKKKDDEMKEELKKKDDEMKKKDVEKEDFLVKRLAQLQLGTLEIDQNCSLARSFFRFLFS